MIIIGITWTLWAGKWAVVDYVTQKYGFQYFSCRAFLIEKIEDEGWEVNRDTMKIMADSLRAKYGSGYLADELYTRAEEGGQNAILESIRAVGEVDLLREKGHFFLFSVDADPKTRYSRICSRANETDHIGYEKFLSDEQREFANEDPTQGNIKRCMELADFTFDNNGTLDQLKKQIDEAMTKIIH